MKSESVVVLCNMEIGKIEEDKMKKMLLATLCMMAVDEENFNMPLCVVQKSQGENWKLDVKDMVLAERTVEQMAAATLNFQQEGEDNVLNTIDSSSVVFVGNADFLAKATGLYFRDEKTKDIAIDIHKLLCEANIKGDPVVILYSNARGLVLSSVLECYAYVLASTK